MISRPISAVQIATSVLGTDIDASDVATEQLATLHGLAILNARTVHTTSLACAAADLDDDPLAAFAEYNAFISSTERQLARKGIVLRGERPRFNGNN